VPAHLGADLDNLAHELVAKHVALAHERDVAAEQVQVRAAGDGAADLHDDVPPVADLRLRHVPQADLVHALPAQRPHS
jgi:hypothetical protein